MVWTQESYNQVKYTHLDNNIIIVQVSVVLIRTVQDDIDWPLANWAEVIFRVNLAEVN